MPRPYSPKIIRYSLVGNLWNRQQGRRNTPILFFLPRGRFPAPPHPWTPQNRPFLEFSWSPLLSLPSSFIGHTPEDRGMQKGAPLSLSLLFPSWNSSPCTTVQSDMDKWTTLGPGESIHLSTKISLKLVPCKFDPLKNLVLLSVFYCTDCCLPPPPPSTHHISTPPPPPLAFQCPLLELWLLEGGRGEEEAVLPRLEEEEEEAGSSCVCVLDHLLLLLHAPGGKRGCCCKKRRRRLKWFSPYLIFSTTVFDTLFFISFWAWCNIPVFVLRESSHSISLTWWWIMKGGMRRGEWKTFTTWYGKRSAAHTNLSSMQAANQTFLCSYFLALSPFFCNSFLLLSHTHAFLGRVASWVKKPENFLL